ncbi:sugar ABC transporter substrate-binding protein [Nocardioides islandensis]|jgi:simple sugar transport system substrate-binding protein|uniref:Sugar ABC transporter substrate-binding protein n=1 Tax=Nocardioides islandensis TaxID=433663 RepID=A0A930V843_9ACTN|nr:sugar ABC transporter substrate-binding protein [Nocardioides islandensis]MBF4762639.1 sugar ABC transporter substrate-binding protein [Nocardioides islandensis]
MKRRTHLLAAVAATALLAAGCSNDDSKAADDGSGDGGGDAVTIGFITKFPVDFYDTMVDAAKAWDADEAGAEVLFAQGKSGTDDEGEIAAIQSFVTQQVDAIVITPTSPNVQDDLQKAVDAGIVVILVDNDIPDWDAKTSVVATDNKAGGELAGQWLAENLPDGAQIAVLQGVLGNPSLEDRVTGMKDALGDAAEVVAETPTDCDQTKGLDAAQDILTAHPDIDGIYAACGPPLLGALEAIDAIGKSGKLVTVGFDASPDELAAIGDGTESGSVAQFPDKMGSMGVQAAFDAINGKDVPPTIDTGTEMVTSDNVDQFQ